MFLLNTTLSLSISLLLAVFLPFPEILSPLSYCLAPSHGFMLTCQCLSEYKEASSFSLWWKYRPYLQHSACKLGGIPSRVILFIRVAESSEAEEWILIRTLCTGGVEASSWRPPVYFPTQFVVSYITGDWGLVYSRFVSFFIAS